jgi:predicted MFS family arabinose efflux permease
VVIEIAGWGFMIHLAATNTFLQTIVEERLRGRVMSFYTMAFFGTVPIGSLLGGVMADRYGAMNTVLATGVVCLAGSAWFAYKLPAIREVVRPIYQERGIITVPAVDTGGKTL